MAPKKITVGDDEWEISSADEFKSLLSALEIKWICRDGKNIIGYESLKDGGTYTLGPRREKQPQVSSRRFAAVVSVVISTHLFQLANINTHVAC